MRNRFNKQLTKEFNQAFKPNLDKDLLKEELNIQPKQTKCFSFKKKQFIALALTCVLLLVAVTSITTWAITKYKLFNDNSNPQTEEVDVIKMFQEKYPDYKIQIVSTLDTSENIKMSIMHIFSETRNLFVIHFYDMPNSQRGDYYYNINVNNIEFSGKIIESNNNKEIMCEKSKYYTINLKVSFTGKNVFEFCTTI